jgi:signal transduction histidine kinase/CheY-like chemotaxis protein
LLYKYLAAAVLLAILVGLLSSAYSEVRRRTIADFNAQQLLMAQQAALGIRADFDNILGDLDYLARQPAIQECQSGYERPLEDFYNIHADFISGVTRMDATGRIVYTAPYVAASIGADISQQEHVRKLLTTHQPVISDVFQSVQGYRGIACHVPVFQNGQFAGSVATLIPLDSIARRHLAGIHPAGTGFAWVLSRKGVYLFSQHREDIGRSVEEVTARWPGLRTLAQAMMAGEQGSGTYERELTAGGQRVLKQASYCPVHLSGTYWSIAVATPETDVLATMTGFRKRFAIVILLLLVSSIFLAAFFYRAWVGAREAKYRARQLEEQQHLTRQMQLAEKVNTVGRLAAGLAHDLNNLLTPILGNSEVLLQRVSVGSDSAEMLAEIQRAGLMARDLIRQLLAMGQEQLAAVRPVDLHVLIHGLEQLLRRTLREGITLQLELAATDPRIMGDPGYLERALLNLVLNAKDAMPAGGVLTISTRNQLYTAGAVHSGSEPAAGDSLLLQVRDTGCGMPPEILDRIFEPFFTTKEYSGGVGLGLAAVRSIVSQHGGEIQVTSSPHSGSVFSIFLPQVDVPQAPVAVEPPSTEIECTRMLLVEDNEMVRLLAQRVLEREGFAVHAFEDAEACLAWLEQLPGDVQLLVTDIIMPGMDGQQLAQLVQQRIPHIHVLFMSGYAEVELQGLETGGNRSFLAKPFTPAVLLDAVHAALPNTEPSGV